MRVEQTAGLFRGVIVDNSPKPTFEDSIVGRMEYVSLGYNSGIAKAQNEGLRRLRWKDDVHYVLFLDQDSRFTSAFPSRMVAEYKRIDMMLHGRLSCLGPVIVDKDDKETYHSVVHKSVQAEHGFLPRQEVISSGSCIATDKLAEVGLFDEKLFIDFVDSEWCFRAAGHGLQCGQTERLTLEHKVGRRKLHFGRHIILISAPRRYYYQYRNIIILSARKYVPASFKFFKGAKMLIRLLYFPFIHGGLKRWKYMNKGMAAGLSFIAGSSTDRRRGNKRKGETL